ncbi:MFS transporter [Streptomyces noursei]|uniref:MFS transporter n=1 Tax=Streptomyces noursei TaxID=1971 RepID=A0A059VZV5_STRNR|nr:MFS transporter [Streptomyces noursei]AIA04859.1 major facilitator superfamily permease [Streptomyces noursei]EXU88058.1 transporter [Streptomyces noursei PD-1]UWS73431.1 MFS transporter [Streptomyces noursei]GCB92470.1 MFS transporter [Streptomyces noursei]
MATTSPAGVRGGHAKHGGGHGGSHDGPMTHRQIMEALSGLLLGMFVAILSSTIVSNALPHIIHDLHGGQSAYTWVVTAALLAMTATTPLWGKLSDLFSKKALVQIALIIYVSGSVIAGLSQNTGMLIACRVVQGIGVGGLSALAQIVMAAMISPRERGRYSGYLGATFAVATVGGPLLGGVITDTSWLGWRWCFYVGVPFAIIALIVLQKTLKLPVIKREGVKVDWLGSFFIAAAVTLLLVWVTLAGTNYDWISWQTFAMVGGAIVLAVIFVIVESKVEQPLIPLRLFRNKTITLATIASLCVGVGMYSGTVFFSQYFQLAEGKTPTMSGIMTIPMVMGLFLASMISGQIITRTGRWKVFLVSGGVLLTAGLGLLGTLRTDTPYWHAAIYMALMGLGVGMMMQNLVLATQNQVAPQDIGSASSLVTFFRTLGGAVGVSALGAVLANRVTHYVTDGLTALGPKAAAAASHGSTGSTGIPDLSSLPAPIRSIMEDAYGHGVGDVFLYAAPFALLALLITLFIKEVALRSKSGTERSLAQDGDSDASQTPAAAAAPAPLAASAPASAAAVEEREPALVGAAPSISDDDGLHTPSWAKPAQATQPLAAYASAGGGDAAPVGPAVHGFVRNAEGSPVPRSAVTLISLSGRQLGRSVAQANGSYALQAPGAGSYVLIAAADGHQPQASTVVIGDAPHAYDILLSGTSGLVGLVRSAVTGEAVGGAMVVVTDVRGEVLATGLTPAEGTFAFAELTPGTYTVAVNAANYRPTAQPVEVGGQGTTRTEVELLSGARVQGVVRAGADRTPLADARVTLVDAAGNVVATSTTGADGAYAFTDLDAGDYTVIASGYPPVASGLAINAGGVDGYDVQLAHPGD